MRFNILLIVFAFIYCFNVMAQNDSSIEHFKPDIIYAPPFYFSGSKIICINDTILKNNFKKGSIATELFINRQGKITGFNIYNILLKDANDSIFFYYYNRPRHIIKYEEYSPVVQKYYDKIKTYVYNINVHKEKSVEPDSINIIGARFQIKKGSECFYYE
jgi:hypothetical protein